MRSSSLLLPNLSHAPARSAAATPGPRPPRVRPRALGHAAQRTLELALALCFLVAGAALLADVPAPGADFELVTDLTGAGPWLRITAGVVEVGGALCLAAPTLAGLGALLLTGLMAATAVAYVLVLHTAPTAPSVLLLALVTVAYARRATLAPLGAFLQRNL